MEHHQKLVAALACGTVAITAYHLLAKHHGIQHTWHATDDVSHAWAINKIGMVLSSQAKSKRRRGAVTYDWAQSLEEVLIEVLVPACTTAGDILVTFGPHSLLVMVGQQCAIDGELSGQIETSNSSWRLEGTGSRRILSITLCKCPPLGTEERFAIWDSLLMQLDDSKAADDQDTQ